MLAKGLKNCSADTNALPVKGSLQMITPFFLHAVGLDGQDKGLLCCLGQRGMCLSLCWPLGPWLAEMGCGHGMLIPTRRNPRPQLC